MYLFRNCPIYFQFKLMLVDSNKYFFCYYYFNSPINFNNTQHVNNCCMFYFIYKASIWGFYFFHFAQSWLHCPICSHDELGWRMEFLVGSVQILIQGLLSGPVSFLSSQYSWDFCSTAVLHVHVPPSVPTIHVSMMWETLESCGCVY